jgi:AsmA protein
MPRKGLAPLLILVTLVGVAAVPWTVATAPLARALTAQIAPLNGLSIDPRGAASISLLPFPVVRLEDVVIRSADDRVQAQVMHLKGEIRLLPLLGGRIEVSDVVLEKASLRLALGARRFESWGQIFGTVGNAMSVLADAPATIGRVTLLDSTVSLRGLGEGDTTGPMTFTKVNAVVNPRSRRDLWEIGGSADLRGTMLNVRVLAPSPERLRAGTDSPASALISTDTGSIEFTGRMVQVPEPQFTGEVTASTSNPQPLGRWLLGGAEAPRLFDKLSLSSPLIIGARSLALNNARIGLGENRFEGALTGRQDGGRWRLAGTMAAGKLNLQAMMAPFTHSRTQPVSSHLPLPWTLLELFDLDLRISATEASLGGFDMQDAAFGLMLNEGRGEITLGRANLGRGTVKGRLALSPAPSGVDVRGQGSFERIDIGPLSAQIAESRWLTGQGSGNFQFETNGNTVMDLRAALLGRGSMLVRQGEIAGVNLPDALRQFAGRAAGLNATTEIKGGRSPFEQLTVTGSFGRGELQLHDLVLASGQVRAQMQGRVVMDDHQLDLRGTLVPGNGNRPIVVPVRIGGQWSAPVITTEAPATPPSPGTIPVPGSIPVPGVQPTQALPATPPPSQN